MTFLATLGVDPLQSLAEHIVPLAGALNEAQVIDGRSLDGLIAGKVLWRGASSVGDADVDWVWAS